MFIYLDESGNLTGPGETYFIVGSYTVGDRRRIGKAFRKWQVSKFPKKIKDQPEVKFKDPHIDDELRLKTIKYLAAQDIRIFYTFLKKTNIPKEYRKKGKVETGLLYAEIVRVTLELYLPVTDKEFIVIRDRRTLKGMSKEKFHEILKASLLPKFPPKTLFNTDAVDSTSSPQIQVADWISGALARYHEKKDIGDELYAALKKNNVEERELFSDYWSLRWK